MPFNITITAAPYNCPTDGTSNCYTAFLAFKTACQGSSGTLEIPFGTYNFTTTADRTVFDGITDLTVNAHGSTFIGNIPDRLACVGAFQFTSGSNDFTARLTTPTAGATTVTVVNAGDLSNFAVNDWVYLGALDLQGNGSYPSNNFFGNYRKITQISGSVVTLNEAMNSTIQFRSTYPNYQPGGANSGSIDAGGPFTMFALNPTFNTVVVINDLKWEVTSADQINLCGLDVTLNNCEQIPLSGSGVYGLIPSAAKTVTLNNCIGGTGVEVELDKAVEFCSYNNCTVHNLNSQSAGAIQFTVSGGTYSLITCCGLSNTIENLTITDHLGCGPGLYGLSRSVTVTNCNIADITDPEIAETNVNSLWTITSGVITMPSRDHQTITSASNSGGIFRITMASTAIWGSVNDIACGVVYGGTGATGINGVWTTKVVSGTQIDLMGSTFGAGYTGSSATIGFREPATAFVTSGHYFFGSITSGLKRGSGIPFQIIDVIDDAANGNIKFQTDLSISSWPTLPIDGTTGLSIFAVRCPVLKMTGCTNSPIAVDLSQAGAYGKPLFSYTKRSFDKTNTSPPPAIPIRGQLVSITIDVTSAFDGPGSLSTTLCQGVDGSPMNVVNAAGSATTYAATVNLKVAGTRVITPTGVTFNGSPGVGSGDSISAPGEIWLRDFYGQLMGGTPSGGTGTRPNFTIEIITDQGIDVEAAATTPTAFPKRTPKGQVHHPHGWHFVR